MHVPYSMDDSEPDLYGSLGSYTETTDDIDDRYWSKKNVRMEKVECVKFFTQEDINKLLHKHMQTIDEMRRDIVSHYNEGWEDGYQIGLTHGKEKRHHQ